MMKKEIIRFAKQIVGSTTSEIEIKEAHEANSGAQLGGTVQIFPNKKDSKYK